MKIYSWGPNNHCQLGTGDNLDKSVPNEINLPFKHSDIDKIFCGSTYSFIIKTDGLLYVCGSNNNAEIGCQELRNYSTFVKIEQLFSLKVISVATGWDFSVILTENGDVYSSGKNKFGQLGICAIRNKEVKGFSKVNLPPVAAIKAGMWHVVALSKANKIWTWGYNNRQQLGIAPSSRVPQLPTEICLDNYKDILFIVAGAYHSGFSTNDGDVIMWGDNRCGQCGFSPLDNATINMVKPRIMQHFLDNIDQFECGWSHALVKDTKGFCYTWGSNKYMQLGRSLNDEQLFDPVPGCVNSLRDRGVVIKDISCGNQHNLVLDKDDKLWSWGWNEEGMLGQGDLVDRLCPDVVKNIPAQNIVTISHGGSHSFVVFE